MKPIENSFLTWMCKICGKANTESPNKEILCNCCRKDYTETFKPFDLDIYIEEFKRANFTHVNDLDRVSRASIAVCDQVCKWLKELKQLRKKKTRGVNRRKNS